MNNFDEPVKKAETDAEILDRFSDDPRIAATLEKDPSKTYEDAMLEIYRKLRPGEPPTVDSAESLLNATFYDTRRYDLSAVGRYSIWIYLVHQPVCMLICTLLFSYV